jgi:HNH endonuclease
MAQAEAYRDLVEARAGGACEYCRLLQAATGVTFHIEHLLPRSRGGQTVLSNLALSCPGQDESGRAQALFNPRHYEPWLLGWHLRFTLDHDSGIIQPRSAVGEATIKTLHMNDPLRVFARKLQIVAGLIG